MENPTQMEAALALLVQTFADHAGGYEEGNTMKNKDFRKFITEQLPHIDEVSQFGFWNNILEVFREYWRLHLSYKLSENRLSLF